MTRECMLACRDLHKLREQPQISAWRKVRAELVAHVHECGVWVRACGQNVRFNMKEYACLQIQEYGEHYMVRYSDSDDDEYSGCEYTLPPEPSEQWLAACPAVAWASMRVAAINRPSLGMLLGPE